ncbi:MAG: CRISPR-associated helicase Cas3' [Promethearchaeia archaeon]
MKNLLRVVEKGKIEYNDSVKPIYAHYKNQSKKEGYDEHVQKVSLLFNEFLDRFEKSFFELFNNMENEFNLSISCEDFKDYLLDIVKLHDIGKVNPKFQKNTLGNPEFDNLCFDEFKHSTINPDHSYSSAVLAASFLSEKYSFQNNPILLLFPYIIWGHHTRLKNSYDHLLADLGSEYDGKYLKTTIYLSNLLESQKTDSIKNLQETQKSLKKTLENVTWEQSSLSILYNFIYSLLIRADSIASSYSYESVDSFNNKLQEILNDRIDKDIFERMKNGFEEKQDEFKEPEKEIDKLRQEMFKESHKRLNRGLNKGKRVFYLKMPTGGGKTNTSMGLALEILKRTSADRIIYALPYTNIIDQNYRYIKDVFDLKEPTEVRKIYSGTETIFNTEEDLDKSQILSDDDFYNYPVICTTNVSFFNSIVKFKRSEKTRFSSLARSVVILDEVQSLPTNHWPTLNYIINEVAEKLNIYFIIMSATVPKLNKLIIKRDKTPPYKKNIHHIIKNSDHYFNKFDRNKIKTKKFSEFNLEDDESKSELESFLRSIIKENLKNKYKSGLIVVNTVNTSRLIYNMIKEIKEDLGIDYSLGLLNSTFLPHQKKKIIDKLNKIGENDENFILVSTQSIEAGMDVDFGFVIRDFSTLDSIEQVRGRCNREIERNNGNVYIFKLRRDSFREYKIYDSKKIQVTRKILENTKFNYTYADIEKYYEILTNKINEEMEEQNKITDNENVKFFNKIKYEDIDHWKNQEKDVFHIDIIENKFNDYSFFVKTKIPLKYFSKAEKKYIKNISKKEDINFIEKDNIKGSGVLVYYISEKEKLKESGEYLEKKIFSKEFGSILQKFIFQITGTIDENEIIWLFGEKKEYFYIIEGDKIGDKEHHYYSLEKGFDKEKLHETHSYII